MFWLLPSSVVLCHLWLRQLVLSQSAVCLWRCWHETSHAVWRVLFPITLYVTDNTSQVAFFCWMYNYDLIKECVWTCLCRVATPSGSHPTNLPMLMALIRAGAFKKNQVQNFLWCWECRADEWIQNRRLSWWIHCKDLSPTANRISFVAKQQAATQGLPWSDLLKTVPHQHYPPSPCTNVWIFYIGINF